ncbi:hypothetical protein [Dyadobacter sp. CY326]|uniref:hypothetical protein n=1 Tax=Dyadobacter sp. CY326 TaxID=2907300 RepID=UPI001F1DC3CB|nr:hypothetical protein [Dyadobacter sp. CY326]MCE7064637.1 hypothetical protein [Dyadobacter sp. CY326]
MVNATVFQQFVSGVIMRKISFLLFVMIGMQLMGCKTAESTIAIRDFKNHDPSAADHILFLDFEITRRGKKTEVVELVNAVSGRGKMKNLVAPVQSPYQIRVLPTYSSDRPETEMAFEHPLYRSVEVASQDGRLSKHDLSATQGTLSIRVQEDKALEKIELYSITPEKGKTKIYTLNLKQ